MSEHIPKAAVEANARELARQYGFDHVWTHEDTGEAVCDRDYWMDVGRKGLAAALPHLASGEVDYRQPRATAENGCCGECYQLGQPCCMEPRPEPLYRVVSLDGAVSAAWPWSHMLAVVRGRARRPGDPHGRVLAVVRSRP